MTTSIVDFARADTLPEASRPAPERLVAGDPRQLCWNHYTDPSGRFHAGVWQGEAGAWKVFYDPGEEELCTLLEGVVRLTEEGGAVRAFRAGDSFVVPGGFRGTWENVGRVRKVYAIGVLGAAASGPADPKEAT